MHVGFHIIGIISSFAWTQKYIDAGTLTLGMNAIMPLKGSSLVLSCIFSDQFISNGIEIRKGDVQITSCTAERYLCKFYKTGYSFTTNQTGVFSILTNLSREAEGTWICRYTSPGVITVVSNLLNVTVYTIPPRLDFTQEPNINVDLSLTSAQLQCRTSGCTYPSPLIQWLIQVQTSSSPYEVYATNNQTGTVDSCESAEQIYTSTLILLQNTVLADNSDKTFIFSCRTEYPDPTLNRIASGSNTIIFTVRAKEAVMQQNNLNITDTLIVSSGLLVTLTCMTGTCRPAASIYWYIGSQKKGNETSLTFIPSDADHDKMIYCQAYNIDPSQPVSSLKPRLFVKVRVTEAALQQNGQTISNTTFTVTSGKPTTLSCVTGTSRPAANIDWYIGSQKRGNGTSLNFIPTNEDHDKAIYCQAYNIDPNQPVLSNKPILFVIAAPRILDVTPNYKGYVGQDIIIQFDFYSNTEENLTVTARHSNSSGLIHRGTIRPTLLYDLPVYSSHVPAPGYRATLVICIFSEYDFGQYDIEVENIIGSDSKSIKITEQITPEKPINFHASNVQDKQLSLRWLSGYHGGYAQTFIVEASLDNITWINVSLVSAGNRDGWFSTIVGNLIPGSEYYLRLYAYNIHGRGDFSDVQFAIKTLKVENTSSLDVGMAVGVGFGGAVVGLIAATIAFTIRRRLNGPANSCFKSKGKTDDEMHTYSNTEMNPQTVKPIYEELNKENAEWNVYDKISGVL